MITKTYKLNDMIRVESRPTEVAIVNLTYCDGILKEFWFDDKETINELIKFLQEARDKTFGKD